jgi:adenylate cyclase
MAHLSLSLLGPFQATLDGEPITSFEASKVRALLAYLAIEANHHPQGHPRTVVAGLLWPERSERAALANLRNALANLRTAIGDRAATPPYLLITRETIQFNLASDHWLDVAAFRSLVDGKGAEQPRVRQLEEAVALYRGDLLHGFSVRGSPEFEDWSLLLREQLQRQVVDALRWLIGHYEKRSGIQRACELARRQVALAPWEEEAHRQLMRLLARSGQRGAALAQYEACRQALAQELGVEPGPETTALYERIRDRDLDPVTLPPFLRTTPADAMRRPNVPFVDRERELAQLDGYLQQALAGQGRVVLVSGEAGTGKTTLVGEFARRAQARHTELVVAGGNCDAYTGSGDPYLPFREILAQLTGDVESRWAAGALSAEGARRLWRLMPLAIQSLLELGPGLIDALLAASSLARRVAVAAPGGAGWRTRLESILANSKPDRGQSSLRPADLHVQVAALLSALAREHPLLLVLDDLQWADADSIDLLLHIGRRLAGSRILLAGIYRPSEVALGRDAGRHPLASLIHEFQRQFGALEVDLPQAGGRQFVDAFLDSEPNRLGAAFRQALYARTRGHALCTVEMLRDMQERGDLVRDEAGRWVEGPAVDWHSLPVRVEGAIGERLDRLPSTLRETLQVASIEGETFTAEVVAQVRGVAASEMVAQLSGELDRRHRLVVSEGSQPMSPGGGRASRYRFRHIMFQAYAYGGLDKAERAYLHEAVGNALEHLYAGQAEAIAVHLARHYHAAARMDKAADYALLAGDRARGLYAYAEAREHYDRALEALAQLSDTEGNRRRRVDALIARAICSAGADPWERDLGRLSEAERLAQALPGPDGGPAGDRARLARIHLWMGRTYYLRGRYRECVSYYQRALAAARELSDAELIGLSSSALGHAFGSRGHFGEAEALFRQVMDLLEEAGDRGEWARARMLHGSVLVHLGDYAAGIAGIQRAYAQLREMNALSEMSFNRLLLSLSYRAGGDLPRAIEAARHGLAMAEQTGRRVSIYDGYMCLGWALCRAGQFDAAAAHASRSRAILQELGGRLVLAHELAALDAEIALGAARVREALSLSKQAAGVAQEMVSISGEGRARRVWGQALAALETPRWDEAEAQLAHSLRLFESGQARLEAARTLVAWGIVCRDRGDLTGAQVHWERAAAQWETSGLDHELARTQAMMEAVATAL